MCQLQLRWRDGQGGSGFAVHQELRFRLNKPARVALPRLLRAHYGTGQQAFSAFVLN